MQPPEDEEVKLMRPLAKISNFLTAEGVIVRDMKWMLNDTFLVILTSNNKIVVFDVLLQVFRIVSKTSEENEQLINLEIADTYQSKSLQYQKQFKLFGFKNQVNF